MKTADGEPIRFYQTVYRRIGSKYVDKYLCDSHKVQECRVESIGEVRVLVSIKASGFTKWVSPTSLFSGRTAAKYQEIRT